MCSNQDSVENRLRRLRAGFLNTVQILLLFAAERTRTSTWPNIDVIDFNGLQSADGHLRHLRPQDPARGPQSVSTPGLQIPKTMLEIMPERISKTESSSPKEPFLTTCLKKKKCSMTKKTACRTPPCAFKDSTSRVTSSNSCEPRADRRRQLKQKLPNPPETTHIEIHWR